MNVSDSIQVPSGVLLIDKARDMTSHDVVAIARRSLGIKKIGHCGTLDPMATGLLMLVVGKATKLQDKLMCEHKEYAGTLMLGVETSSQDAMGEIVAEYSVDGVTEQAVREAFDRFDGVFEQIPPMVSAIKKGGVPLYKLARKGQEVVREPRPVEVFGHGISRVAIPEVDFTVQCSKGFYWEGIGLRSAFERPPAHQVRFFYAGPRHYGGHPENRSQGGTVPGYAFPEGAGGYSDCRVAYGHLPGIQGIEKPCRPRTLGHGDV